jgi:ATP-dependent DNA helicase RecG
MTANEVDTALALPPSDVGGALLELREDQWFDRKGAQVSAKDLGPILTAFANAEGGVVVVGLHGGNIQGTQRVAAKLNDYRQSPFDFTVPPVRTSFELIPCVNDDGDSDELLVIRVDPAERVHETQQGDCYLRIGDETRRLNFAQRQELEFDKGQSQFDGFAARDAEMSNLSVEAIDGYKQAIGATSTIENLLRARSLLTAAGTVTNAAVLLFGRDPHLFFPQAEVRVLRYLSDERGTGARLGLEDGVDIRVVGSIPQVITEASERIDDLIPRRRALSQSGRFEGTPIVPRDAWLEGLVNAVIHRSYSLGGDHIRFEIYPNRIEIESPGRFPGLASPARPLEISRFARNPRIARVCADLRIGQELGEGIKRIFEEMRRVGLTDPIYRQSAGSVKLTLTAISRLDRAVAARLPSGSQRVLDVMRSADAALGTGQLAELLEWSRPATITRLRALEREALIIWSGKSPKDPRAVWLLPDS